MRRTDGDETWIRLLMWTKGQKSAERLAAHILKSEGFISIDPSHPLGGRDGLKDIICSKSNLKWIAACYFPRNQKPFKDIKAKFESDYQGVNVNNAQGFTFITNQELSLGERKELQNISKDTHLEVYHLERLSHILNCPQNYGVRYEFLDIEMSKEEQLSYFVHRDSELSRLSSMIESVMNDYSRYRMASENDDFETRSEDEVSAAIDELFDKVWYNRHHNLRFRVMNFGEYVDPKVWEVALQAAKSVEEKYGLENLGPWDDFEWGMINGKLSALRWFFGEDWDMLDT